MAIINTFLDPTIILDEMAIGLTTAEDNAASVSLAETAGKYFPVVQLNTFIIDPTMLQSFKLTSERFLPEVQFSFADNTGIFKSAFYPKDGDIISVYIRSHADETFKPVRIDFDILSFSDTGRSFSVRGIMNIPLITSEICKAYPDMSTHLLLQTLSTELQLGFASNEDETVDSMNWINAYNTYKKFIQDSTQRSYLDDRSFFTSYVDVYYYINLININKQFEEYEPEEGIMVGVTSPKETQQVDDSDLQGNGEPVDLFLSNHPTYQNTNFGIIDYKIYNESGTVWHNNGYKRFAQFFDLNDNQYYSFFVDPTTTEGAEETSVLMKGRPGDLIYEDINKYKYLGVQLTPAAEETDDGEENSESEGEDEETPPRPEGTNVHRNYQFALVQNAQNLEELKKITIKATLPTVNSQLHRYQTVPILIYETDSQVINTLKTRDREVEGVEEDNTEDLKLNTLISGIYVIQGISYVWDEYSETVRQELTLTRREWPIQLPREFESRVPRKE